MLYFLSEISPLVELETFGNNRMNLSAIYLKENLSYGLELHLFFWGYCPLKILALKNVIKIANVRVIVSKTI